MSVKRKIPNEELNRIDVAAFKQANKLPVVLILDDIRSLNNVGAVFRTSDAFRIEKIYLCGITPRPPHRDIQKTALGATESVSWAYAENAEALVKTLAADNYEVWSVEQVEGATMLNEFTPNANKKLALVFGNEVKGVSQAVVNTSDGCIEIPQFGTKHSINISVSVGVVVWDVFSKIGVGKF